MSDISVFEFHEAFAVSEHIASLLLWNPFLFHSFKILILSINESVSSVFLRVKSWPI